MNKKKILSLALVVALIAIMVTGSLAYFTADDEVTNTFTVGSVKIEIYENDKATDEPVVEFDPLTPVVNTNPSEDESYQDKVVEVKNTGANAAYIRVHIAVPTALIGYLQLDVNNAGWSNVVLSDATIGNDNVPYTVFTFDHLTAVDPGAFTAELLKGAYLVSAVDLEENANGDLEFILRDLQTGDKTATSGFVAHKRNADGSYTSADVNILVAAQAIQAQGFDATAQDAATAALNAGFGTGNPWQ